MKISIITAAFNSCATLRDTLESVLRQTWRDVEHIVVDGGSADGTVEMLRDIEPRYGGRLRWISEPDGGIYDAMNKGIAMAEGDIIGILNSDDYYSSEDVLARVVSELTDAGVDAVYGDIHYIRDGEPDRCVRYYSSRQFQPWMMRFGFQPAHPSFYCRRTVYDRYGGFDTSFRVAADFEHMLRLIHVHGISIRYVPMDFVTMRTGGASTSGMASHRQILRDHLRAYRKNGVQSNLLFDVSRYAYKVGELVKSRSFNSKKTGDKR